MALVEMYKRGECRCSGVPAAFMRYVPHGPSAGTPTTDAGAMSVVRRATPTVAPATGSQSQSVTRSEALIVKAVEQHLAKHNELPSRSSTDTTGLGGRSWATAGAGSAGTAGRPSAP